MSTNKPLFSDFETISSKQWKQQIQYELKGADYNETLVWESPEGIKVKPFYHNDEVEESNSNFAINSSKESFKILQNIFVHDVKKSNERAINTLNRGAESIRFTIENETISIESLMQNLPLDGSNFVLFFHLTNKAIKKLIALLFMPHFDLSSPSSPFGCLFFWYSVGVIPNCFKKILPKFVCDPNPTISDTS